MSTCIRGREAILRFTYKDYPDSDSHDARIIFPAKWSEETLMDYVKREHPKENVELIEISGNTWPSKSMWIANPQGFSDFERGISEDTR